MSATFSESFENLYYYLTDLSYKIFENLSIAENENEKPLTTGLTSLDTDEMERVLNDTKWRNPMPRGKSKKRLDDEAFADLKVYFLHLGK